MNLPKLGLDEREPNTDRLDNLWVFPSRPAEASKKGGSRTRGGEVGTGSTLPKDMMEMTERGAPGPNATSTRRIFMLPVSRTISSTKAHSGSGGSSGSPITSITPIDFLKPM